MKVVLFDFFGVLSTPVYKQVIDAFIPEAERGEWMKKLDYLDLGSLPESELIQQISERAGITPEILMEKANNAPRVNEKLFDFIQKSLKGVYTIGLLTNISRNILERVIPDKLPWFDITLVSSDLKLIKPQKEIFEVTIERCHVAPEDILFIDDSEKNIAVAKSLGIQGIVYKDFPSFLGEISPYLEIV